MDSRRETLSSMWIASQAKAPVYIEQGSHQLHSFSQGQPFQIVPNPAAGARAGSHQVVPAKDCFLPAIVTGM